MKYLISLLLLFTLPVQAALYTSSVVTNPNQTVTVYYFNGPASSDTQDLSATGAWWYGVSLRVTKTATGDPSPFPPNDITMLGSNNSIPVESGDTWDTLAQKYIDRYGVGSRTSSWGLSSLYRYEACMSVSRCASCGGALVMLTMPNSCSAVPVVPVTCNISQAAIQLDHGALQVSEVDGDVASADLTVSCSAQTHVVFRVLGARVNLGKGITSKIYISGTDMGGPNSEVTYEVPSWGLTVPVESRLESSNPQEGQFSGSTVIIVNVT